MNTKILLWVLLTFIFISCTVFLVLDTKKMPPKHTQEYETWRLKYPRESRRQMRIERMKFIQDSIRYEDSMRIAHPPRLPAEHTHKNLIR